MEQQTITRIKLIAGEGMYLTNGETYGKEVFLGTGDSPDNWHEITEEEYRQQMEQAAADIITEEE